MKNKHLQKNLALRIGILVVIVAYIVYYYNKYLQDKSPGWTILFALFLIFISAIGFRFWNAIINEIESLKRLRKKRHILGILKNLKISQWLLPAI